MKVVRCDFNKMTMNGYLYWAQFKGKNSHMRSGCHVKKCAFNKRLNIDISNVSGNSFIRLFASYSNNLLIKFPLLTRII